MIVKDKPHTYDNNFYYSYDHSNNDVPITK